MNKKIVQGVVVVLLVFFLLTLADLVPFWMPMMGEMIMLLIVTILLLAWVGFVMFENTVDEREEALNFQSGRVAYLVGIGSLLIALVVQGFTHTIDPWIPVVLAVMVFAKFGTRYFLE